MAKAKLPEGAKALVVQRLARFESPSDVAEAVKQEFGIVIARQSIEFFDPTKHAGRNLAPKWRTLFEKTRETFIRDLTSIAVSHRTVRLRALQRMADKAEERGDGYLLLKLLEQAAREVGGMFTGRREFSPSPSPAVVAILPKR
ncbi:DUF2280 domain-containing protein [Mesorhizobium sp. B3-1-7]|uniref:DUF2280 domain-containing protein n=1 Tax=Mesorhizobium sp. B3-1-7 TaxID=2589894 RepID=UPI00112BE233|nr:DUF2280 domain-containing protein [Mesorhizobium sp. B3-1-7]TPI54734.1 DUF2280 domain-containing protein [Mesorhizobium sp. B3-1-7]